MRIAFITFEYPPFIVGGAGVYATYITKELAKLGHEVVVFSPGVINDYECESYNSAIMDNKIIINRIKVHAKIPMISIQFWLRLPHEINKYEAKKKFDIIHFNGICYSFLKKRISKAFHVLTVHHLIKDAIETNNYGLLKQIQHIRSENNILLQIIEKRAILSVDKIITVSNFTRDKIINSCNIHPNNIEVVHNGISLDKFCFEECDNESLRNQFSISSKPIILFVGRINDPRKGLPFLLDVFKQVLSQIDCTLVVVGKGDITKIEEKAKILEIDENVIFAGFVPDDLMRFYYSLCDVYVCSSNLEGFGLTILEAMVSGKPVVATNVGAIPEIVNPEALYLSDYGNVFTMSQMIVKILKDKKFAKKIGEMNRDYATEKFSWSLSAQKIDKVYNHLFLKAE